MAVVRFGSSCLPTASESKHYIVISVSFLLTLITWRILYDSKHEARQRVREYVNESVLDPLGLCGRSQFVVARL